MNRGQVNLSHYLGLIQYKCDISHSYAFSPFCLARCLRCVWDNSSELATSYIYDALAMEKVLIF